MNTKGCPMTEFFGEPIHQYTRSQAIEDGALIDVSSTAHEAGFRCPVAITNGVLALINNIPSKLKGIQDFKGRLWDVVWMAKNAAKKGGSQTQYSLIMYHEIEHDITRRINGQLKSYSGKVIKQNVWLKMIAGPGDQGELVITIMLPNED